MGATVFNNARVRSRKTNSGVAYLWEENTHCIKDGPKQASWCAMGFGNKADIIGRIYRLAPSIPGGMLKVGGRSVTAFVDAMLKCLDHPEGLAMDFASLENHNKGFYTAINDHNRQAIREHLIKIGRSDLEQSILDPEEKPTRVNFSLDTDFNALRDVINVVEFDGLDINERPSRQKGMPVWKAFRYSASTGMPGPTDGLVMAPEMPKVTLNLYRSQINLPRAEDQLFVCVLNGETVHVGSILHNAYELRSALIEKAGEIHVRTGHSVLRPLMKALEGAIESPSQLPDSAVFTFQKKDNSWSAKNYEEIRALLGKAGESSFRATAAELEALNDKTSALVYIADSASVQIEEQQLDLLMEPA